MAQQRGLILSEDVGAEALEEEQADEPAAAVQQRAQEGGLLWRLPLLQQVQLVVVVLEQHVVDLHVVQACLVQQLHQTLLSLAREVQRVAQGGDEQLQLSVAVQEVHASVLGGPDSLLDIRLFFPLA
eukprot:scaffold335_cov192-Ochromonas_danica.AAC.4